MSTNTTGLAIFDLPESFLMDLSSEHESMTVFGGKGYKHTEKSKKKKSKKDDEDLPIIINIINNNYNYNYSSSDATVIDGSY